MAISDLDNALERRRVAARTAYAARDLDAYRAIFSKALEYRQCDGEVIDRRHLMKQVETQFMRLGKVTFEFTRESLAVVDGEVQETLVQVASAEARAFGVLRRVWHVERRGVYTWAIEDDDWRIKRVHVLSEKMRGRWKFGP